MENKKTNIVLIVIVCVLVAIIACSVGIVIGNKMLEKSNDVNSTNSNNNDNNANSVVEKDYDLNEATKLINKYAIFKNGYDESTKKYIAWTNVSNLKIKEYDCSVLYENIETTFDGSGYKGITGVGFCDLNAKTISYSELNESYQYLFGKNNNIEEKGFAFFDYVNGKFVQLSTRGAIRTNLSVIASDDENMMMNSQKIYGVKSAITRENLLVVDVAYTVLKGEDTSSTNLYSSFDKNTAYTYDDVTSEEFKQEFVNKYSNQMDTYIFTFEFEEDHYILKDIVKQ